MQFWILFVYMMVISEAHTATKLLETLRHEAQVRPTSANARYKLGTHLLRRAATMEDSDVFGANAARIEAVGELVACVRLRPDLAEPQISLAIANLNSRPWLSYLVLKHVISQANTFELRPDRISQLNSLAGAALTKSGRAAAALEYFQSEAQGRTAQSEHAPAEIDVDYALALLETGHHREAYRYSKRACDIDATSLQNRFECAEIMVAAAAHAGKWSLVAKALSRALSARPSLARHFGPQAVSLRGKSTTPAQLVSRPLVLSHSQLVTRAEGEILLKLFRVTRRRYPKAETICFSRSNALLREIMTLLTPRQTSIHPSYLAHPALDAFESKPDRECIARRTLRKLLGPKKWLKVGPRLSRHSKSVFVLPGQNALVDAIEARIERTFGIPAAHALPSQLLQYRNGESYQAHTDCTTHRLLPHDRVATVLVYLNDVAPLHGGRTAFTHASTGPDRLEVSPDGNVEIEADNGFSNFQQRPILGTAIAFFSASDDPSTRGVCDPASMHMSTVLTNGTKFILQKWYTAAPVSSASTHAVALQRAIGSRPWAVGLPGSAFGEQTRPRSTQANMQQDQDQKAAPFLQCDAAHSCREYFQF